MVASSLIVRMKSMFGFVLVAWQDNRSRVAWCDWSPLEPGAKTNGFHWTICVPCTNVYKSCYVASLPSSLPYQVRVELLALWRVLFLALLLLPLSYIFPLCLCPPPLSFTIAILGDGWWLQTAKQDGDRISKQVICSIYGRSVMSAQMLEVYLLGEGTVLRFERDAWPMF